MEDLSLVIPELSEVASIERQIAIAEGWQQEEGGAPVDENVRGLYERFLQRLHEKALEAARNPELQTTVASLGQTALSGIEQLERMSSSDIFSQVADEELASEAEALKQQYLERIEAVYRFFEKYETSDEQAISFMEKVAAAGMAVRFSGTEVVPTEDDPANPERKEEVKIKLTLKVSDSTVTINDQDEVPFSKRTRENQADYTDLRRAALLFIADHPEGVSVQELIEELSSKGIEANKDMLGSFRSWAGKNLVVDGEGIIINNGMRGNQSRYMINPIFEVSIEIEEAAPPPPPPPRGGSDRNRKEGRHTSPRGGQRARAEFPPNAPIKPEDVFQAAWQFKRLAGFLKQNGLPQISDEVVERLEVYKPQRDGQRLGSEEIVRRRQEALDRVSALLEDTERHSAFIQEFDPESPEYDFFVTYLGEFLAHWEALPVLPSLINARIEYDTEDGHPVTKVYNTAGREIVLPTADADRQ